MCGAASWQEIQSKLVATLFGEHHAPRTVRQDAGRNVCWASGALGARIERASRAIEVGRQSGGLAVAMEGGAGGRGFRGGTYDRRCACRGAGPCHRLES